MGLNLWVVALMRCEDAYCEWSSQAINIESGLSCFQKSSMYNLPGK